MSYFLMIALTAGAFAAFRLKQKHSVSVASTNDTWSAQDSEFACVQLTCGRGSCRAARRIRNVTQLASEAPVLPLPGCEKGICTCSYRKTSDRRQSEGRRMIDVGIQPLIFDGNNQRFEGGDRRD